MHRWLTTNREMYSSLLASHAYQVAICWEFYNEAASFMWTEALIPNTSAEWHMVNSALFVTFFLWCISLILLTFFSNQLLLSLLFAYILYFSLLFLFWMFYCLSFPSLYFVLYLYPWPFPLPSCPVFINLKTSYLNLFFLILLLVFRWNWDCDWLWLLLECLLRRTLS